jgi:DNA-binding NarL/FixJ family response regulator
MRRADCAGYVVQPRVLIARDAHTSQLPLVPLAPLDQGVARATTLPVAVPREGRAQVTAASQAGAAQRAAGSGIPHLTPRELEVLAILTAGKTNREIAAELSMSVGTVKSHLSSIYAKLGVWNRTEAAIVGLGVFPMLRALAS